MLSMPLSALHILLLSLLLSTAVLAEYEEEELLIGWKGETWDPSHQNGDSATKPGPVAKQPWIETISWSPRAFVHHNFLTEAECDHLVELGKQRVARSMVIDSKTGQQTLDDIRTSYGAAFKRGEDSVVAEVEQRIAEWTHIPPENGEAMQVLRYMNGQKYGAHWDWFGDDIDQDRYPAVEGNRLATVLLYLSDVEEGGETSLPLAEPLDAEAQRLTDPSECAARGTLAVRPRKGDALMFFNLDVKGEVGDHASLHASCPTLQGTKWTATKWIHTRKYKGSYDALQSGYRCEDKELHCEKRARAGQCDTNLDLTGPDGRCRKTCNDCIPCLSGDIICARGNMRGRRKRKSQ